MRDLPANGQEFSIEIAQKFRGSSVLMPWAAPYMSDSRLWPDGLDAGAYEAEFSVTGEGLDRPFVGRFRIINPEGEADPSVELL